MQASVLDLHACNKSGSWRQCHLEGPYSDREKRGGLLCDSEGECQHPTRDVLCVHSLNGCCTCAYLLEGVTCQFKPCHFFSEAFCGNHVDPHAWFILKGIVFGFRVIDDGCEVSYDVSKLKTPGDLS